ncbi:MAG: FIST C-terminal domain-containing protein [Deltaproteobacteria bacterium]|nr:FIST C-terminal domain-containing protein [Deltaproteobacteria bacterium]MBW1962216.1 FIST C-terminal domain-containing protein [Deltaproteobacteria bacterium]MBW1993663.1 FIST C-terminal domain-containing protein [Deltaproteobacteria bacterium]MBW2150824.1 FIST C-terminal domain-containing protein [Deltaproteobacteria bacterium]
MPRIRHRVSKIVPLKFFERIHSPLFSTCAFRKDVLGTRTGEELRILRENLPPQIPIGGFYTFGEIAPLGKGQKSFFHGATLVTLLMGQPAKVSDEDLKTGPARQQDLPHPEPDEAYRDDVSSIDQLKLENRFLKRKLNRLENYRRRLEEVKDFNAAMHRTIIQGGRKGPPADSAKRGRPAQKRGKIPPHRRDRRRRFYSHGSKPRHCGCQ